MERVNNPEKLKERIDKHETMDLLRIMENKSMEEEFSFLMKHRTAVALEDIATELKELNGHIREWKEEACRTLPWQ